MADRQLRLLVGAAIDASFGQVMQSVVEAAKRARRQIATEMVAGAKEGAKAQQAAAQTSVAAIKSTTSAGKTAKEQADAMAADVLRKAKANAREKVAIEKSAMNEVERDLRQHNARRVAAAREAAKDEAGANRSKGSPRDLSRGAALVMRAGGAALGMGSRMLGSIMHGMGVDTSVQGQLQGSSSRQALAVDVASQGYIGSGKGPKGSNKYTDPNEIMAQAQEVGNATGTGTEVVLEGLDKFVKMTGDLQTARDAMADIGKIAKANGADMGDMMEAAANVSIAMGEIPDKGKHLGTLMRTIAGQGHLGAVAIKDMASQMGKLTAQANFFKIDPMSAATLAKSGVVDPTSQRVAVMGAMAQWARAKGGRITAGQATQSSMAFIRDLASPTEVKRLKGFGLSPYTDDSHSTVRDPLQMFLEAAKKAQTAGGLNRDVINKIFPNIQSRAVGNAMMQDYNAAFNKADGTVEQKHQAAMESLTGTFQNYLAVTQSGAEVQLKFNAAMATTKSQAAIMNNELGKASDQLAHSLLPAVQALTPVFVALATTGADALSRILGIDTAGQAGADKLGTKGAGVVGRLEAAIADAQAPDHIELNPNGTQKGWKVSQGKLNEKDSADAVAMAAALKKAIADKAALVDAEGTTGSGMMGLGKNFNRMTDKELAAEANNPLGDVQAKNYMKDKAQLEMLKSTLERLSTSIDKLEVLRGFGKIQDVKIVADATATPAGAEPATSGTSPVDSDGVENSSHR